MCQKWISDTGPVANIMWSKYFNMTNLKMGIYQWLLHIYRYVDTQVGQGPYVDTASISLIRRATSGATASI